jgi:hypothetical protein
VLPEAIQSRLKAINETVNGGYGVRVRKMAAIMAVMAKASTRPVVGSAGLVQEYQNDTGLSEKFSRRRSQQLWSLFLLTRYASRSHGFSR